MSRTLSGFLFISLLFVLPACFGRHQEESASKIDVVNKDGQVTSGILKLLQLTNIEHDGTLADIVVKTQASWLRKPGTELWHIPNMTLEHQEEIIKTLKSLHFYNELLPTKQHYQYLFLMGGIFKTMIQRIEFIVRLWDSGIRFDHVVLLGGARPAAPELGETKESVEAFTGKSIDKNDFTETDFITYAYNYSKIPNEMRSLPVTIIDVPMQTKPDGSLRRPTAGDTVEYWLKTNPTPGTVLAIANQPYIHYQNSILHTFLPAMYPVETVGYASPDDKNIGILLDTIARTLYQEKQRLKI